jgi:hypothetical protein
MTERIPGKRYMCTLLEVLGITKFYERVLVVQLLLQSRLDITSVKTVGYKRLETDSETEDVHPILLSLLLGHLGDGKYCRISDQS